MQRSPKLSPTQEKKESQVPSSELEGQSSRFGSRQNRDALHTLLVAAFNYIPTLEQVITVKTPEAKTNAFEELWKKIDGLVDPSQAKDIDELKKTVRSNFADITKEFLSSASVLAVNQNKKLMLSAIGVLYRIAYMLDMMETNQSLLVASASASYNMSIMQKSMINSSVIEAELEMKTIREKVSVQERQAKTLAATYAADLKRETALPEKKAGREHAESEDSEEKYLKISPQKFQTQCQTTIASLQQKHQAITDKVKQLQKDLLTSTDEKELSQTRDTLIKSLTELKKTITATRLPVVPDKKGLFLNSPKLSTANVEQSLESFKTKFNEISTEYDSLDQQYCDAIEKLAFPEKDYELFRNLFVTNAEAKVYYDHICLAVKKQSMIGLSTVWQNVLDKTNKFFRVYQDCGGLDGQTQKQHEIGENLRKISEAVTDVKARINAFCNEIVIFAQQSGLADVQDEKEVKQGKDVVQSEKSESFAVIVRNIFKPLASTAKQTTSETRQTSAERQAALEAMRQARFANIQLVTNQIQVKIDAASAEFCRRKNAVEEAILQQFRVARETQEQLRKQELLDAEKEILALNAMKDEAIAEQVNKKRVELERLAQLKEEETRREQEAAAEAKAQKDTLLKALSLKKSSPPSSPVLSRHERKPSQSDLRVPLLEATDSTASGPSDSGTYFRLPSPRKWGVSSGVSTAGTIALTVAAVTLIASNPMGWAVGGALMLATGVAFLGAAIYFGVKAYNRYKKNNALRENDKSPVLQQELDSDNDVLKEQAKKGEIVISRDARYFKMKQGITFQTEEENEEDDVQLNNAKVGALRCSMPGTPDAPLYFNGKTGSFFFRQQRAEDAGISEQQVNLNESIDVQLRRFRCE